MLFFNIFSGSHMNYVFFINIYYIQETHRSRFLTAHTLTKTVNKLVAEFVTP